MTQGWPIDGPMTTLSLQLPESGETLYRVPWHAGRPLSSIKWRAVCWSDVTHRRRRSSLQEVTRKLSLTLSVREGGQVFFFVFEEKNQFHGGGYRKSITAANNFQLQMCGIKGTLN